MDLGKKNKNREGVRLCCGCVCVDSLILGCYKNNVSASRVEASRAQQSTCPWFDKGLRINNNKQQRAPAVAP